MRQMEDLERWLKLWKSLGATGDAEVSFAELQKGYDAPGRFYHTLRHVRACIEELDGARAICEDPRSIELALWFHDVVYDPRAADNEAQSAQRLAGAAVHMGLDDAVTERAVGMVLQTAHEEAPGDIAMDFAVVRDVDLAILGKPPQLFAAYEAAIRKEYAFLPERDYRTGRSRVLGGFLGRKRIYCSDFFRVLYEEAARANLQESVRRLEAAAD
jgi:predicted metal-dependent HD superfamily phosphohydrolase